MRNVAWRKLYLYLKREKSFNGKRGCVTEETKSLPKFRKKLQW